MGKDQYFQVGDHDFSRCSLVPSVTLEIEIPDEVGDSWYKGVPHVCLKDAVFQPSSPMRHALEVVRLLEPGDNSEPASPMLFLYTDGGKLILYIVLFEL